MGNVQNLNDFRGMLLNVAKKTCHFCHSLISHFKTWRTASSEPALYSKSCFSYLIG